MLTRLVELLSLIILPLHLQHAAGAVDHRSFDGDQVLGSDVPFKYRSGFDIEKLAAVKGPFAMAAELHLPATDVAAEGTGLGDYDQARGVDLAFIDSVYADRVLGLDVALEGSLCADDGLYGLGADTGAFITVFL